MPGGFTDKNISSFKEENFTLPPPPEVDMPPPPGFNESDPFQGCENAQNNSNIASNESKFKETPFKVNTTEITPKNTERQNGNGTLIKWYYLLPLFLIPLLLFFLMNENAVVADAEFLQNVKAESSIFHKFRNIYVTPRIYSEISKQNKNIAIHLKTTYLNKNGKKYLNDYGDETLALAKQIKAKKILTGKNIKECSYNKYGFETLQLKDIE